MFESLEYVLFGHIEPKVMGYVKLFWHQFWSDGLPNHVTHEISVDGSLQTLSCKCGKLFYSNSDKNQASIVTLSIIRCKHPGCFDRALSFQDFCLFHTDEMLVASFDRKRVIVVSRTKEDFVAAKYLLLTEDAFGGSTASRIIESSLSFNETKELFDEDSPKISIFELPKDLVKMSKELDDMYVVNLALTIIEQDRASLTFKTDDPAVSGPQIFTHSDKND